MRRDDRKSKREKNGKRKKREIGEGKKKGEKKSEELAYVFVGTFVVSVSKLMIVLWSCIIEILRNIMCCCGRGS